MNKLNIPILILAIFSAFSFAGYAMAATMDTNVPTSEKTNQPLTSEIEIIKINEFANVINITENSNETAIVEMMIGEDQRMSSMGFSFVDLISPFTVIILVVILFVYIRKSDKVKMLKK